MAAPERNYKTAENNEQLLAKLERINADENPTERAQKLDGFYEGIEVLNEQAENPQDTDEQGTPPTASV